MADALAEVDAVKEFKRRALGFCAHLEGHAEFERGPFLRQLAVSLAQLYIAALHLPDVSSDSDTLLPPAITDDEQRLLEEAVSRKLGEFQAYWEVFDPFAENDAGPVAGNIAADLVEIYCDVRRPLSAWDATAWSERLNDVTWSARFDFVYHWSRHATACLKAVDALLNRHFVEALEPNRGDAYEFRVETPGARPPFGFLAEHLWGPGVDFDSDGNSRTPDDREWTELTIIRRDHSGERVNVDPVSDAPLILRVVAQSHEIAFKTAQFLATTTGGRLTSK
jgi:hypothetical protein